MNTPFPQMNPMGQMGQMPISMPAMGNARTSMPMPRDDGNTLYVGNLEPQIDEQKLHEHFNSYGPLRSLRIMRDIYTGESRGFAFVTFSNLKDAKRAKLVLNHSVIYDNPLRICFKRSPAQNKPEANLYISNIDPKVTARELEEACGEYGNVISSIIRTDDNGDSLGYGYIQFETEQAAIQCIEGINGNKMYEKEIHVQKFVPRGKRVKTNQRNNLYLKGFPADYDEAKVREFIKNSFEEYGVINSLGIFLDKKIGRYYAFAAFEKGEEAQAAVKNMSGFEFNDEDKLFCDFAQQKRQRRKMLKQRHMKFKNETNLYIKSIRADVTIEQFNEVFKKYGAINSSCLKKHNFPSREGTQAETDSKELQFGFVNFPKVEEAKIAFTEAKVDPEVLDLIDPSHNEKIDFIFYAQPKTMRTQYLKMIKKNNKASQILQQNMMMMNPMFRQFSQMMMGRRNFKQQGNKGPRNFNKRGRMGNMMPQEMMQQMNFGMPNFMMMQQGMNPQMQQMMMQSQQMPGMAGMPAMQMNPQQMMQQQMLQQQMMNMNNMKAQGQQQPLIAGQGQVAQTQAAPVETPITAQKDLGWLKENLEEFESMSQREKKNILGTMMYSKVVNNAPANLVPKITGMLIDLDVLGVAEILDILGDEVILKERIDEAVKIIEDDNDGN